MSFDAYGWDEPAPYLDPPDVSDREYGLMQDRIDTGRECPKCHAERGIEREVDVGIALFVCRCGCKWFDMREEA